MNSSTPGPAEGRPHLQVADPARLRAAAEDDAWSRFAQAENAEAFCQAWLAVTCIKAGAAMPVRLARCSFRRDQMAQSS